MAALPVAVRLTIAGCLVAVLVWLSMGAAQPPQPATGIGDGYNDLNLYSEIAGKVAAGENYYQAAIETQRATGYPVTPFTTVRLPTLALVASVIPAAWIAIALLGANVLLWMVRLPGHVMEKAVGCLALICAGFMVLHPQAVFLHDLWAGLLVGAGLALYRPDKWWPTMVLFALACAIREHAIIAAGVMGLFALAQKRWREVAAWLTLGVGFAMGIGIHAATVNSFVVPGDLASQGWLGLRGLRAFFADISALTMLRMLPPAAAVPLAFLPLVGWIALREWRTLAVFAAIALVIATFARSDNFYWAFLALPAYAAGLAYVPRAVAELAGRPPKPMGPEHG